MTASSLRPATSLFEGLRRMREPGELFPWDDYYARMAQTDFLAGQAETPAVKSFFVRYAPFESSFYLLGGVTDFLGQLSAFRFTDDVLQGLRAMGYRAEWLDYLRQHPRPRIRVVSGAEGAVTIPHEPAVSLIGPVHDLRIAEGILLPALNPACLWLTKWRRLVDAAAPAAAIDFGRRRAQDPGRSSLYAYLAGCTATSNSQIRAWFDIPVTGTSGHEAIQSLSDERAAFDLWLTHNPAYPTLLVDTINTLESGVPHAIAAFKRHRAEIRAAGGKPAVRIDSGDLAYLGLATIRQLNDAGLADVGVILTNDLDEYRVEAIKTQIFLHASEFGLDPATALSRIIAFPAGTRPATSYDQPALGGVMKLVEIDGRPTLKISDNPSKTSLPGFNRSAFVWKDGTLVACVVFPSAHDPFHPGAAKPSDDRQTLHLWHPDDPTKRMAIQGFRAELRQKVVYDTFAGAGFTPAWDNPSLDDVRTRIQREVSRLHWSHRRLESPHEIKLSVTPELFELRRHMVEERALWGDVVVTPNGPLSARADKPAIDPPTTPPG